MEGEEEDKEEEDVEEASKETTITPEQIIVHVIQERLKEEQRMDPFRIPPVKVIGCARVKIVTRRRKSQTPWMVSNHS